MSELEAVHRGQSFLDSLAEQMAVGNLAAGGDPDGGETSDADRLARLAGLSPIEYDRQREAVAKAMSIRSSTLDKMVKELRQEKSSTEGIDFDDVEPWPHPVQPAALLSDLAGVVRRFIICPDETAACCGAVDCDDVVYGRGAGCPVGGDYCTGETLWQVATALPPGASGASANGGQQHHFGGALSCRGCVEAYLAGR
jgi:hypothetical protein